MDPSSQVIYWILIVVLVIFSAFFSAAETALNSCNQFSMQVRANENHLPSKLVSKLIDNYDVANISVVVGNNIVNSILSTFGGILFSYYFANNEVLAQILSTIVFAVFLYIFGETIPKIVARKIPDAFARFSSFGLTFIYYVLYPINYLMYGISNLVKKLIGVKKEDVTLTEDEFSNYIEEIENTGIIDEDESDIIQNSIEFMDITVREVYTPFNKMYAIDLNNLTVEKLNKILLQSNYSRIPMYYKNKENIVGILNIKTYFNAYMKDHHISILSVLTKPYFVSPNVKIDDLFDTFKSTHNHIALIKNANKIIGMITMEDILEELVDEISEPNIKEEVK